MKIDHSGETARVTFEARGWARMFIIVFLLVWLGGWAVGEWFAIRGVVWAVQGGKESPAFRAVTQPMGWIIGGFIVLWVVGWTIGGVTAIVQLGRLVAGRDQLTITPSEWIVFRGVGPIGIRKRYPRSEIDDLYIRRRNGPLILESGETRQTITSFAKPEELREVVARFWTSKPRTTLPARWTATAQADGRFRIARRRFESPGCLVIVALLAATITAFALVFATMLPRLVTTIAWVIAVMLIALVAWGAFSRRAWLVGRDHASRELRWLRVVKVTPFDPRSMHVDHDVDSDGDETFSLRATTGGKRITVYSDINEDHDVLALARFFEEKTGWRVPIAHY